MNLFQDVPVFRKRLLRLGIIPSAVVLLVAIARFVRTPDLDSLESFIMLVVIAAVWSVGLRVFLRGRARTILIKTRGLACTDCGYSLVGMEESGQCPECGRSYYADHLSACWSRAAGFPRS